MTPEDIERMAREAGFDKWTPAELVGKSALDRVAVVGEYPCGEALTRFAALVRAQALEDAARMCEAIVAANEYAYADECAAAIRALAGQPGA